MGKYADMVLAGSSSNGSGTQAEPGKYSRMVFGETEKTDGAQPKAAEEGWGGWLVNTVKGRKDPAYGDLPSVYSQFPQQLENPTGLAAMFGASDPQMADVIQSHLGDNFVRRERDANGYDVFVTRGADGKEQRGYVNRPGLDLEDLARGVRGALPFVAAGGAVGAATRGAGIGIQALAQGGAAGGTSIAGDVAQIPLGSEQGVELGKAAVVGGLGMAGPPAAAAAGSLWRRFVTIPGLVDKATGQLTSKGIEAARQAGIDPADITPDFARRFSQVFSETGDAAQAATQSELDRFGIPATRGQVTKDPYLLTQEEGMRRRLYGEQAQDIMRGFDKRQEDAIRYGALGGDASAQSPLAPAKGIGQRLAPDRSPGEFPTDTQPATLGESVQGTLQTARKGARIEEGHLWDDSVKSLAATPEALQTLTPHMEKALANETAFTATGEKMAEAIGQFAKGDLPVTSAGGINLPKVQTVDQMRRKLGQLVKSAEQGSDKHQAGMMYDAFNDWIGQAADQKLLAGDPAAAMQLVKARAFTREVRQIFDPKAADGTKTAASRRLSKVIDDAKADSGEGVIQALFGSQGSRGVNDGTVSALKSVKTALDRFVSKDQAAHAWNDIRLAYWARLVTNKDGEMLGPKAISGNLKQAFHGQRSILDMLYSPLEQREMRAFLRAIDNVAYKPPNASGSGYTAASFAKDGIIKVLNAFGLGRYFDAAVTYTGVGGALNTAAARQAVRTTGRTLKPNLTPAFTAPGSAYARDQSGDR